MFALAAFEFWSTDLYYCLLLHALGEAIEIEVFESTMNEVPFIIMLSPTKTSIHVKVLGVVHIGLFWYRLSLSEKPELVQTNFLF